MRHIHASWVTGLAVLVVLALAACGGGGAPEERTFDLEITDRALTTTDSLQVKRDDSVTLRIATDEAGTFHLHGYDLDASLTPGEVSELSFEAHATGRFDFELHPSHADDDHSHEGEEEGVVLGSLEVHPR